MKGGLAKQKYLEKVKYNQQVAQVNQLYQAKLDQGMTQAQAAVSQAGDIQLAQSLGLPGYQPGQKYGGEYVVGDGDTVAGIAEKSGTTVPDLLAANPDVRKFETGLVVNTPNINPAYMQYSQKPQQNAVKAPQPVATNQPQVAAPQGNLYASNEKARIGLSTPITQTAKSTPKLSASTQGIAAGGTQAYNPVTGKIEFMTAQNNPFNQPFVNSEGIANPQNTPDAQWAQNEQRRISSNSYLSQKPNLTNIRVQATRPNAQLPNNINIQNQFRQVIENGMIPTQDMLDWGVRAGLIQKMMASQSPISYGGRGGGGFWGRGRGGGGGRGGGSSYQGSQAPAFGSGSAFRGLVYWRM